MCVSSHCVEFELLEELKLHTKKLLPLGGACFSGNTTGLRNYDTKHQVTQTNQVTPTNQVLHNYDSTISNSCSISI